MKDRPIEPSVPLEPLDPASEDPAYWIRFRSRVLAAASGELNRRRRQAEVTIPDLVLSWGRLLVPGTVATAAAAAFLLFLPGGEPGPSPVDVEELLVWTPEEQDEGLAYGLLQEDTGLDVFLVVVEGGY